MRNQRENQRLNYFLGQILATKELVRVNVKRLRSQTNVAKKFKHYSCQDKLQLSS